MKKKIIIGLAALLLSGCGQGSSPGSPYNPGSSSHPDFIEINRPGTGQGNIIIIGDHPTWATNQYGLQIQGSGLYRVYRSAISFNTNHVRFDITSSHTNIHGKILVRVYNSSGGMMNSWEIRHTTGDVIMSFNHTFSHIPSHIELEFINYSGHLNFAMRRQ